MHDTSWMNAWAAGIGAESSVDSLAGSALPAIKANVLIVDDKPNNLFALAQMLEDPDQNVVQATSGADALRWLLREDFAIVLIDVQMPAMDGYELATLIRQRERTRGTPIIFITAFGKDDQDIARGYVLGAVDYVFKPVDPIILKAKISVFVDLYKKTEAIRQKAEQERRLQIENLRARTEKMEAERALRQIEARQSLIIRSLHIALYTAELNGQFTGPRFLSERIAGMVGFEAAAFTEDLDLWTSRIHPGDLPRVLAQMATIVDREQLSTEYRWRCADGSERVFLDQAVLIRDEGGAPKEIFGTCLDVTDRRQLEQRLLQSQKMEAIGQLTGGIAHDFNNMLSVIIWNLDAVTRALQGSGKVYDRAQMALNGALNCAELTRRLLTVARTQPHQAKAVDPSDLIPRLGRLLSPALGEQIRLDIRLPEGLWPVLADPAQMESALLNLAINARDAMPQGGSISIEAWNTQQDNPEAEPAPGDYVVVAVTDSGTGMTQEVVERAFEPFFTTKGPGEGSGLGLAMVYGFAKQSGGHVEIDSTLEVGTTVRLYLPRTEMSQSAAEAAGLPARARQEERRVVLVVEDNAAVRQMTVARLQDLGHDVLEAEGSAAAVDILGGETPIDVLFTDVVMPGGMSGIDLARRALQMRPSIKVLFASGYASSFHTTGGVIGELLQKPYRDEDLQQALTRAFVKSGNDAPEPRSATAGR